MSGIEKFQTVISRTLLILLAFTIYSFWMLGGLYARYVTKAEGGDNARVAYFQIADSNTLQKTYKLVPMSTDNQEQAFTVNMSNNSETAVRYTFSIEKEGNLPLNITAQNNGNVLTKDTVSDVWSVERAAGKSGDEEYKFTLSLDNTEENYRYSGGVESIRLTVKAEQID